MRRVYTKGTVMLEDSVPTSRMFDSSTLYDLRMQLVVQNNSGSSETIFWTLIARDSASKG